MKIAVDTNVLVRGVVRDDENQARIVGKVFKEASLIAVSLPCLCEFVWVLRKVYGFDNASITAAIRALVAAEKVAMNRPAVEAGLAILDVGGDFADGVMAYEGDWLGAETFVSFDKKAVPLLTKQGQAARLL
ncbi:MAG: type II toxin-antitoxin system VapC family toxin [Proteobacteria bacterium]|nr:type II toxin-antitoxin system VapC family toxin [Pseudomonadota bacterium]